MSFDSPRLRGLRLEIWILILFLPALFVLPFVFFLAKSIEGLVTSFLSGYSMQVDITYEGRYLLTLSAACMGVSVAILWFVGDAVLESRLRNRRKILLISFMYIIFFDGALIGGLCVVPRVPMFGIWGGGTFWRMIASGTILPIDCFLEVQVSPPGYPVIGDSWIVRVWEVNATLGHGFRSSPNSTVVVTLLLNGHKRIHELAVDRNGEASFQYLSGYDDISFRALKEGFEPARAIVLTRHFVPHIIIDAVQPIYSAFSIILTVVALVKRGKIGRFRFLVLLVSFSLSSFVAIASTYARFFQYTVWGYPSIIFGFVDVNLLKYASVATPILLAVLVFHAVITRFRERATDSKA